MLEIQSKHIVGEHKGLHQTMIDKSIMNILPAVCAKSIYHNYTKQDFPNNLV